MVTLPTDNRANVRLCQLTGTALGALADFRGTRDKTLLLVGFAAGLRRSEIVALDPADPTNQEEGRR